jgi:hypothetical protein
MPNGCWVARGARVFSGQINTSADKPAARAARRWTYTRKRPKQTSFATFDLIRTDALGTFSAKQSLNLDTYCVCGTGTSAST